MCGVCFGRTSTSSMRGTTVRYDEIEATLLGALEPVERDRSE
jgi:hypothetical protein